MSETKSLQFFVGVFLFPKLRWHRAILFRIPPLVCNFVLHIEGGIFLFRTERVPLKIKNEREKMKTLNQFKRKFAFDINNAWEIGVERECFLTDTKGNIVPIAPKVLKSLEDYPEYTYELSACQLECRAGPSSIEGLRNEFCKHEAQMTQLEQRLEFKRSFTEVGPHDIPLDVYPDPSGRYARIVETLPKETLRAACRVIGTHVHVGMPDHDTAIRVYNKATENFEALCEKGNGSFGERLEIYRIMAPNYQPKPFGSWQNFYETAIKQNFVDDPKKCWTLIRISVHGTIEFRMFGATSNLDRVISWAKLCHDLCWQVAH